MTTAALRLAQEHHLKGQPERLSYGSIELEVTDLRRAASFWSSALGLQMTEERDSVVLGTAGKSLVILHGGATEPVRPRHSGLYHVALGVPSQQEFSRLLTRLIRMRIPISPVDHTMSKAIYLSDPDGLGIEIAYETPERFGRFGSLDRGFSLYDAQGQLRSGRDPLDIAEELGHAEGQDPDAAIAEGTQVAHLHLHVPDLRRSITFYERFGFAENLVLPQMGFADLGAGGPYTHRLALNIWQGTGTSPAPSGSARLKGYTLKVEEPERIAEIRQLSDAGESDDGLQFVDPSGVVVKIRS